MRSMALPVLPQRGDDVLRGDRRAFLPQRSHPLGQLPPPDGEEFLRESLVDRPAALTGGDQRLEIPGDLVPDHEVQLPRGGRHRVISLDGVTTLPHHPTHLAATCQSAASVFDPAMSADVAIRTAKVDAAPNRRTGTVQSRRRRLFIFPCRFMPPRGFSGAGHPIRRSMRPGPRSVVHWRSATRRHRRSRCSGTLSCHVLRRNVPHARLLRCPPPAPPRAPHPAPGPPPGPAAPPPGGPDPP